MSLDNCPDDEFVKVIKNKPVHKATQFLLDNNYLGDKSGQGFYKKTDQRDEKGGRVILALDLNTLEYKPTQKVMIPVVGIAKKVEIMDKRLKEMMASDENSGHFVRDLICGIIAYASNRIPEIRDCRWGEALPVLPLGQRGPRRRHQPAPANQGLQHRQCHESRLCLDLWTFRILGYDRHS